MKEGMRTCPKCGETRALDFYFFNHNKTKPGGFEYQCKICSNKRHRNWQKENPEKVKEQRKRNLFRHPEKRRVKWIRRLQRHPELKEKQLRKLREYVGKHSQKQKELFLNRRRDGRINLSDYYIKRRLRKIKIPLDLIDKEMIEAKRSQLKAIRILTKLKRRIENEKNI